ncbi:MAG: cyanophycin synthetase, partial [Burkholderiales bacterium]|nr:cyanophycin synthetase [Burkholderiales bacterium]
MEVKRIRALRGPNLWSRHTAIEAIVVCSEAERAIDNLPGFETRLRARFPEIDELKPTSHEDAVSLAHALEFAALGLQEHAGCPVTFSRTTATVEPGAYQVVAEYSEEAVGRLAFELAEALCQAALNDTPFDLADALKRLKDLDEDVRLGPSTGAIVEAAVARGIPYRRLTDGSLVQFGWGSKQRRIQAAEVDGTSAIAESIAQDKELTKRLLHAAGVPVPFGRPVRDAEDAWVAALEIGLPVVVKPQDGNQGKGVTVNITTREHLEIAYRAAREFRDDIMVERYLPGHDFRLLVVGDKLVAAARRDPPHVIGDGVHTVRQLVDQVNSDPRRGDGHATSLTKIRFDDIALARLSIQGLNAESVPEKGRRVVLRNNANLSTGGTATDVTDDVHPEVAARAIAAARMIGLHICGVDVVCNTVLNPLEEQGGGIVEVNAAPGLRMHLSPSFGKGRPVGEAIVDELFGNTGNGRVPVVAVTGTNGKTTTVRLIAHILATNGLRVGMTNTDGVYVNGRCIDTGDCSGPRSARNVLAHPEVDAAVFETARGGILREGLGFDRCDVGVVTNIGMGDHLGLNYITTVEDLAVLKRVIVRNVSPNGMTVLNAADPMTAVMAGSSRGAVTFFAADSHHPVMAAHRAQGHRVVYVENNAIVAAQGKFVHRLPLANVPLTLGGTIGFQVENTMAAVAAAWGLNLSWDVVAAGLASF